MRTKRIFYLCLLWLQLFFLPLSSAFAQEEDTQPLAIVLTAKGPVTPIMAEYLERGLQIAAERQANVVIFQLDTPGGSVDVMNRMVQSIRASRIPVVVYVSPNNAIAGSAGTIITLAGHLAAMAPETTIGAASPVGAQGEDISETMQSKVKEVLKASVRNLTRRRGEEAMRLAEETIESAKAVTVEEALQAGLVDFQANDVSSLLEKIHNQTVTLENGEEVTLKTRNARVSAVTPTFIEDLLQLLVNPNLVFLLLSIGVQAILIELSSPGGWVAGFIGVVCLLLAIYGLGVLPVNWFGILFIVVAFVLFILELKAATHGALTVAGAISFIVGALVLFNSVSMPGFPKVSLPLVIGTGVFIAATFLIVVTIALRAQRTPVLVGQQTLVGQIGEARSAINPRGAVQIAGELWGAELADGESPIAEGERVVVTELRGLAIVVKKAQKSSR
ncbi:MAG: nodulation protein NfeD [Anaerolineae bacterium]|nr:nodulation protein NfeD [Anaerolineae bacterium]